MKSEIKDRIEQIRHGNVPEGYKKTKTDIVPVEWEEHPIGRFICEYTEKTTEPNQYPVLTSARTGLMLQTDYYTNRQVTTEDNVGYNVLPYGYITFRSRSDDGHFRFNENRLIERGIISYFYPVFSFSEEVCHGYMLQLLNQSIYHRMYPYVEGTAQQVLSLKKLGQLIYSLPPFGEQKKIAEILTTQDKVIELEQQKIEEIKKVKKFFLSKMFPKKGQAVPEIRFKGFTDAWEQRKLGELVDRVVRKNTNNESTLPLTISAQYGLVDQITYFNNRVASRDVSNYYLVLNGEFAYNKSTSDGYPFGAVKRLNLYEKGVLSTLYIVFAPKKEQQIDSDFLTVFFDTNRWHKGVAERAAEGARNHGLLNISAEDFFDIDLSVPKDVAEQKQIGAFIRQLDDLITLHQRKLEEEKQKKKALMQLLLMGIVRV